MTREQFEAPPVAEGEPPAPAPASSKSFAERAFHPDEVTAHSNKVGLYFFV